MIRPIEWKDGRVLMIDQRKLPWKETIFQCRNYRDVAKAIKVMVIRGAPAIGIAAAMGLALGAVKIRTTNHGLFFKQLGEIKKYLASQRPTAVNLTWALTRQYDLALSLKGRPVVEIKKALIAEAKKMLKEDIAINKQLGANGSVIVPHGATILTHCNAGALATGGYGTALGVVRAAKKDGKKVSVLADETRPFLQGARLTAWELMKDRIPVTVISDNMAGHFLKSGAVDLVVVGADRIAANGDVANKIGTYSLAVLAKENKVPFYVAAPLSTIDLATPAGSEIPIEERPPTEVTHIRGKQITPDKVRVLHPAFDITPNRYIRAIITEAGLAEKPYKSSIKALFKK
ncbi:MAG: S-methyl-5-thioribose-1-phosphate isomerase [Candidatus Adiutricales bacterium]